MYDNNFVHLKTIKSINKSRNTCRFVCHNDYVDGFTCTCIKPGLVQVLQIFKLIIIKSWQPCTVLQIVLSGGVFLSCVLDRRVYFTK